MSDDNITLWRRIRRRKFRRYSANKLMELANTKNGWSLYVESRTDWRDFMEDCRSLNRRREGYGYIYSLSMRGRKKRKYRSHFDIAARSWGPKPWTSQKDHTS